MKKFSLEFKVGIFVVAAVALLGYLVFKSGDFYLKPGYTVRFIFDYVSGITVGSPVRLAGVDVGEVTNITVMRSPEGATQVEVSCRINQGAMIEDDAEVRINSLSLLSEKYIEILPGSPGAPTLKGGSVLVGKTPIIFERITDSGSRLLNKLETTVDNLNTVVTDKDFQANVKATFGNANKTALNLQEATDDIRDAAKSARIVLARLRDGEGTVGRLLKDDTIAKDMEAMVKDLKKNPWKLFKKS